MTTNTELATLGLNSSNTSVMLPEMQRVRAGKGFKLVQHFSGNGSARDIKAQFKNSGLKGRELSRAVNRVLTGEKSLREQLGVAFVQSCIQQGHIVSHGEMTKHGSKLVLVAPVQTKVEVQSVETDYDSMSADDISALLHRLEGLLDAKVAAIEG